MSKFSLKYTSLVALTIQNSLSILIMRYTRIMPGYEHKRFFTSTAVLLSEVVKFTLCAGLFLREQRNMLGPNFRLKDAMRQAFTSSTWKLCVPAGLYTIQNNLQYVAVSNLDAATYQVTYQLKIITTAIFAVTLLRQKLTALKWLALFVLTGGIVLVQYVPPPPPPLPVLGAGILTPPPSPPPMMDRTVGFVSVVAACTLSGLAGIYFEKVLKGSRESLWALNLQLSALSTVPALLLGVGWKDGAAVLERGFFYGYNPVVALSIVIQASGGLLVALCIAHADNILKNFATSISILLSTVASVFLFHFHLTPTFSLGAGLVLLATYLYGMAPATDASSSAESSATTTGTANGPIMKEMADAVADRLQTNQVADLEAQRHKLSIIRSNKNSRENLMHRE